MTAGDELRAAAAAAAVVVLALALRLMPVLCETPSSEVVLGLRHGAQHLVKLSGWCD